MTLSFVQLPLTLNADDIAACLNIPRGNAYTLPHREGFPTLWIGKRMIAPRDTFLSPSTAKNRINHLT